MNRYKSMVKQKDPRVTGCHHENAKRWTELSFFVQHLSMDKAACTVCD